MPEGKTIGTILTELIKQSGLPAIEVARRAGIPSTSLYSIVNRAGTNRVEIHTLKKLADVLGEDLEVFCGEDGYKKRPVLSKDEEQIIAKLQGSGPELTVMVKEFVKKPPRPLSAEEQKIVDLLAQLNKDGVRRLLETTEDMVAGGRYSTP